MAKTYVRTDDFDKRTPADTTIKFSFDGARFEMDLTHANADKFRAAVQPYIEKATALGSSGGNAGLDLQAVRSWAEGKGIKVGEKGRLPKKLIEEYKAETGLTVEPKKAESKPANGAKNDKSEKPKSAKAA